jgi:plasmid stability protein
VPNAQKTLCIKVEIVVHNFGQPGRESEQFGLRFPRIFAIMIAMEAEMAQLLVRNLEDQLKVRLQRRAKRHGQSMEAETRDILRNALREDKAQSVGFGTASAALFSGQGIFLDEPIAELRDIHLQVPDFES